MPPVRIKLDAMKLIRLILSMRFSINTFNNGSECLHVGCMRREARRVLVDELGMGVDVGSESLHRLHETRASSRAR